MAQLIKKRFVDETTNVMGNAFANGALADATPLVIDMLGAPLPATITLKSAAAGRKIELSSDGGAEYWTPAPNVNTATMHVVHVTAPVSHARITGVAADAWNIR
jgi:hypothetical protein